MFSNDITPWLLIFSPLEKGQPHFFTRVIVNRLILPDFTDTGNRTFTQRYNGSDRVSIRDCSCLGLPAFAGALAFAMFMRCKIVIINDVARDAGSTKDFRHGCAVFCDRNGKTGNLVLFDRSISTFKNSH